MKICKPRSLELIPSSSTKIRELVPKIFQQIILQAIKGYTIWSQRGEKMIKEHWLLVSPDLWRGRGGFSGGSGGLSGGGQRPRKEACRPEWYRVWYTQWYSGSGCSSTVHSLRTFCCTVYSCTVICCTVYSCTVMWYTLLTSILIILYTHRYTNTPRHAQAKIYGVFDKKKMYIIFYLCSV